MSIRAFSSAIGVSDTNTRNYLSKGTKPNSDYLEGILRHFNRVNPTWLLLGEGEPFTDGENAAPNQTNISGNGNNVASGKNGKAIQKTYNLTDCEKERDGYKAQLDKALSEAALLRGQLERADALIAAKDETIDLLKAAFNRPN